MKYFYAIAVCLTWISLISLQAADWPQWRGPHFNGSSEETQLPTEWGKDHGIAWSTDLPGSSAATPIISGDHVLITSTDDTNQSLLAMCLNRSDGSLRWSKTVGIGLQRDNRSNFASPSPVTDGKLAIFFYGNGELAAFDMEGQKKWGFNLEKRWGEFCFQWTFSSSPFSMRELCTCKFCSATNRFMVEVSPINPMNPTWLPWTPRQVPSSGRSPDQVRQKWNPWKRSRPPCLLPTTVEAKYSFSVEMM